MGQFNSTNSPYTYTDVKERGKAYCGLITHFFLLLLTFGIWWFIWIYRVTKYLNQLEDELPRSPTTNLLLCMFVPFYWVYWVYKSAQRLDEMAARRNIMSNLSGACLFFALFFIPLVPFLMQEKINTLIMSDLIIGPVQQRADSSVALHAIPPKEEECWIDRNFNALMTIGIIGNVIVWGLYLICRLALG